MVAGPSSNDVRKGAESRGLGGWSGDVMRPAALLLLTSTFFLLVRVLTGFNYMQISNEDIKVPLLANLRPRLGRNYI